MRKILRLGESKTMNFKIDANIKLALLKWGTVKYLILPIEAEYSFRKANEE